jgi:hypothetical protein
VLREAERGNVPHYKWEEEQLERRRKSDDPTAGFAAGITPRPDDHSHNHSHNHSHPHHHHSHHTARAADVADREPGLAF